MHRTTAQKIRTNFKTRQAYLLQHSNSKAPLKLEPKFGHRLQGSSEAGALVLLYTIQSLHTTTQLLQGSSEAGAKIWSKSSIWSYLHKTKPTYYNIATPRLHEAGAKIWSFYTQYKAYTLQYSYCKAPAELEPKFGHIVHKTKPTHYNTATPRLQ